MTVILVALSILFFLALDWLVLGRKEREGVLAMGKARRPVDAVRVRLPGGIFFAPSHTWLNLFPTGKIVLGVDDFVSRLLEEPRVTLLKTTGEHVDRGEPILRLETSGHSLTVRSPIDGRILTPNTRLVSTPSLMRDALFSDGWAYVMKPDDARDLKDFMLGEESQGWIKAEFGRLRDLLAGVANAGQPVLSPALLQDGGPPVVGIMESMDDPTWQRFEATFLQVR